MPRLARTLPTSAMIHIIGRGNNSMRIFRNKEDFLQFKRTALRSLKKFSGFNIHHYVLMNTHYHFLIWIHNSENLAALIKSIHVSYHHYYRRKYEYKGHLWHSRFRSILMKNESHWLQCARYIELNPVYAGQCKHPENYRWSSYRHYALGEEDNLVLPMFNLPGFENLNISSQKKAYEDFILAGMNLEYQRQKKIFENERLKSAFTKQNLKSGVLT